MLRLQPTQRRCGEMADATDLKSVLAKAGYGLNPIIGILENAISRVKIDHEESLAEIGDLEALTCLRDEVF